MMKRVTLICLVFIIGCADDQELDNAKVEWTVLWEVEDEELTGKLIMFNNNYARLRVNGQDQSLLMRESDYVDYYWERNKDMLTLKRLDNNIELTYEIVKESPEQIELAFADNIKVTLNRH